MTAAASTPETDRLRSRLSGARNFHADLVPGVPWSEEIARQINAALDEMAAEAAKPKGAPSGKYSRLHGGEVTKLERDVFEATQALSTDALRHAMSTK